MNLLLITVFLTMLLVYGGLTYYIGKKGFVFLTSIGLRLYKIPYWISIWVIAFSFFIARIIDGRVPGQLTNTFSLVGGYWMGILLYLIMIMFLGELLLFLNKKIKFIPKGLINHPRFTTIKGSIVVVLVVMIVIYGRWSATNPVILQYEIQLNKEAGDYKELNVVMLSDLHLGRLVNSNYLEKVIKEINQLEPDLILMPGDIIDDRVDVYAEENMAEIFRKLKPSLGIYASMGNHEYIGGQGELAEEHLKQGGITLLRDETVKIKNSFYLVGREDGAYQRFAGRQRLGVDELLIDVDRELPIIMLDHQPVNIYEAKDAGVDIQLSGHTHRGQLFPLRIFTKRLFEVDWGYKNIEDFHIIVTSGAGTWGPPIRVGHRSEIVQIKILFQ
ncbi:metallophosphoesterase [Alkaliphilus serpentinus]|uniref:Metallophosphoesterase n=1 Tax=Alkaliphilus serpentinus TaxID=1482731 RepID=A0A833HLF6_9FIRM|nr:metallophosphoesterase [Alkaliphilus serpentinus]KAB3525619.1 metallophosphoesterase [Alkaliphilus serpentinus]